MGLAPSEVFLLSSGNKYDDLVGIQWNWQSLDSVSVKAPLGGND